MNILVINCGSSSLKYQLINMDQQSVLAIGLVERIGLEGSRLKHEIPEQKKETIEVTMNDHKEALNQVFSALTNENYGAIKELTEINAVGHRVVHAGEFYNTSTLITDEVIGRLNECVELAPLHNPANITGIDATRALLPKVPMVAVFDTAFHQTMPAESFIYPLPYELYKKYGIRRYGFHGTSHKYVAERASSMLGKNIKDLKIITCHLGNGASVTAIDQGKSVATSMGFTPLEGLAMGTRCGDLDPAIVTFVMDKENLSIAEMNNLMNKKSGVLGISGVSSDFRDIEAAVETGNVRAKLALDTFNLRVKKYVASYAAVLGGVDALVFTAGLGENSALNRFEICKNLEFMGIKVCDKANNIRGKEAFVNTEDSKVKVLVIPTNEELAIAIDTLDIVNAI
ncbi:MAG: acetate kinase [Acidaminobacteraceae bacterium]